MDPHRATVPPVAKSCTAGFQMLDRSPSKIPPVVCLVIWVGLDASCTDCRTRLKAGGL